MASSPRHRSHALPLALTVCLLVLVVYPTANVLIQSCFDHDRFSLIHYQQLFGHPQMFRLIWGSVLQAAGTALLSTLLGLIIALTVMKTDLPFRRFMAIGAVAPMILPGYIATVAYIFLFGRNGLLTYQMLNIDWNIYSWRSVIILQTLDFTTTAFFLIAATLTGVDRQVEDAAKNLGASDWKVLITVTLPLIRPGIYSALLLSFLRSLADFGTPFIMGGRFNTLATASYTQLIGRYNQGMASTLNVILLVISLVIFGVYSRTRGRTETAFTFRQGSNKTLDLNRFIKGALWSISLLFSLFVSAMFISVFLAAFTKQIGANFEMTWEHFRILPQRGWNSTRNTLIFASATSVGVCFFGIVTAYLLTRLKFFGRKALDFLATIPFAIPGTFMGVGYALAFSRPPLILTGTWFVIFACTIVRELPLGLRAGIGVIAQQDPSIEDASINLGSSRIGTFFRIIVPMARPALVVSAVYAFISTVNTLGAIIFLITPGTKVLSADVFEATVRGDVGDAAALSVIMILIASLGAGLIYTFGLKEKKWEWLRNMLPQRRPV